MSRKSFLGLILVLGTLLLMADTYEHRQAGISIWFPDSWSVKTDEGLLEASAPGDEVYFQLLVLDVDDLDEAADVYGEMLDGLVEDYRKVAELDNHQVNGLSVFFEDGVGTVDGVEKSLSVGVIQAPDAVVMTVAFCAMQNVERHSGNIQKIARSIKAI